MSSKQGPAHVVVDGSNIATEGRSMPSLAQLSDAVGSFMEEYPDAAITVVVDATFGHRIDKSEVPEFEEGISNNELVAPPAGAVGRGDAFVLGIAHKVGASILSNDSFQEFHGDYQWLFDEGRLVGGKPVPHIGWVFVDRVPVRGPISRKATRGSGSSGRGRGRDRGRSSRDDDSSVRQGSKEASSPMPTPKSPPPRSSSTKEAATKKSSAKKTSAKKSSAKQDSKSGSAATAAATSKRAPKGGEPVNELMPFLDFVEQHPVGTSVTGTVDAYSSHGAYVTIGDTDVRGYVPLNMMADPAPRSAKKIMKQGESVTLVVVSFAPTRRSIDCALPDMAESAIADAAAGDTAEETAESVPDTKASGRKSPAKKTAAKKRVAKKAAGANATPKKAAARKSPAKQTAATKKTAAKKPVAKKPVAKKTAAKKTAATRPATKAVAKPAAEEQAASAKTSAKQSAVKKTSAKKTPVKKSAAKKTAARKTSAKKTAAKKTAATRPAAKAVATQAAAKRAVSKKSAIAKKAPAARTPRKKAASDKGQR